MIRKVILMLCLSALVTGGVIGTDYSPATSVSYSSLSTPTIVKTFATPIIEKSIGVPISYTKIVEAPPVYQSILTTKESKYEGPDGVQHSTFSKSFDTSYSNAKTFKTKLSKDGHVLGNTIPDIYSTAVHSPIVYHQQKAYTYSSPLVHTISAPAYTHDVPLTKTFVSPSISSYTTPVVSKTKLVTSGLSSYSSPLIHTISSPTLSKSVSLPITYTTHDVPVAKTLISPTIPSYTTPVLSKTNVITSGSPYSSHTPAFEVQPIKTAFSYSEAPIVSHMSFSGLGANYAW